MEKKLKNKNKKIKKKQNKQTKRTVLKYKLIKAEVQSKFQQYWGKKKHILVTVS